MKKFKIYNSNSFFCRRGFTLAETLITLVIVGIVAVLTIPNLIVKYQYYSYYVGLRKAYSVLGSVTNSMFAEWGNPVTGWGEESLWTNGAAGQAKQDEIGNYYIKHMNTICDDRTNGYNRIYYPNSLKCVNDRNNVKTLNNNVGISVSNIQGISTGCMYGCYGYPWATADGMNYLIYFGDWDIVGLNNRFGLTKNPKYRTSYFVIFVDVNGKRKPNKLGRDMFVFGVTNLGLFPLGLEPNIAQYYDCNNSSESGFACAGRVIKEKGINY